MRKPKPCEVILGISVLILLFCCALIFLGCSEELSDRMLSPTPTTTPSVAPTPTPTIPSVVKKNCDFVQKKVLLVNVGEYQLPAKAKVVMESHYTTSDADGKRFPKGVYPKSITDGISYHLNDSKEFMMKKYGFAMDYSKLGHYANEWTPAEGGHIGQTAKGNLRPPLEEELWQGNMYFKVKPPLGTRYIFKLGNKSVVAAMGREIGPGATRHMAGLTVEAHKYLEIKSDSSLVEFGEAKDQSLPFGPIDCN